MKELHIHKGDLANMLYLYFQFPCCSNMKKNGVDINRSLPTQLTSFAELQVYSFML